MELGAFTKIDKGVNEDCQETLIINLFLLVSQWLLHLLHQSRINRCPGQLHPIIHSTLNTLLRMDLPVSSASKLLAARKHPSLRLPPIGTNLPCAVQH